jgi:4-amino-4-deoxy-L-arabinose transferase-like glycosyltransferase
VERSPAATAPPPAQPQQRLDEWKRFFWILGLAAALVFLAPIRSGDLAGYDDASYAAMAKDIVKTGDWINIRSNGYPALEHPPLLHWMQAVFFQVFGVSDTVAKLPSALCGLGVVLLAYWLGQRLLGREHGVVAMLVMAGSVYFIKYAARAMTDAPITFFFLCAICAWIRIEESPRWYLAAGAFTGLALLTRGLMGLALPAIFGADLLITRRRPRLLYAAAALTLAVAPLAAWYAHQISEYGSFFFMVHAAWLDREVYGALSPAWRRYTGAVEYAWMLAKSYWPWLPAMIAGFLVVIRGGNRRLSILIAWTAVVFGLCAVARSRVLRYMLPAYPAFAILASIGFLTWFSREQMRRALRITVPVLALIAAVIAVFPPRRLHAGEVRPVAIAATAATRPDQRVAFYDAGQPRFDETNQMLWYGDRYLYILLRPEDLDRALAAPQTDVFVIDRATYIERFARRAHRITAASGHLVCIRLEARGSSEH